MKKFVLIDANALIHRAFHALPALTSPTGIPTNAVYGFTTILLKMIKDLQPDYMAAAFDLAGPTFRHEEFAQYKAHRVRGPDELYLQIPIVKTFLQAFGVPVFEKPGYEADDIVGSLAEKAKQEPDLQVVIVTGDLDTLQLIEDDKVVVFTLRKGVTDTVTYGAKEVRERYGLEPEQMTDFKGLKGDPSDNIPGVPGIGEKTAITLIKQFGSLENLYAHLEKPTTKKGGKQTLSEKLAERLREHKDMAFFSKKLATIIRTVDVDFDLALARWQTAIDRPAIERLLQEYGFASLAKRIADTIQIDTPRASQVPASLAPAALATKTVTATDIPALAGHVCVTITGDTLLIAPDKHTIYAAPLTDLPGDCFDKVAALIGHDLKELCKQWRPDKLPPLFDTKIAAYLLRPDAKDYDFSSVFFAATNETAPEDPTQRLVCLFRMHAILSDQMKSQKLLSVFQDIEMPLIPVLADMEQHGITVDTAALSTLKTSTALAITELEQKIYQAAGESFNINSSQQLAHILFTKLLIKGKVRKTGKGAFSTAAPELEKIRAEHPVVDLVLEYRELEKLLTTYIEPFPKLIGPDGRIHTTYNQTGAGTGRLASQDPNIQNIPTRTKLGQEFRRAFIAEQGFTLVSFDYSQLELRIAAHLAKDETMIDAFRKGEDIHTRTAATVFKVDAKEVTKDMRRQAKVLNFGLLYGMGILGFARAAGIDRERARAFIDQYFAEFHGIAAYRERTKEDAYRNGFVQTLFGRRRHVPDIRSTMPQLQAQAERVAINHPVQGTEADIVKLAMVRVWKYIKNENLGSDIHVLLQVHDELVCEIRDGETARIAPHIRRIMEEAVVLEVPLTVDVHYGKNWADVEATEEQ